jgi:hypothetical protein
MNKPRHYKNAYRNQLVDKINSLRNQLITRMDLSNDYSNQEQLRLNRALKAFAADGLIIKVSHGLYAKAMSMELPNGEIRVVLQDSFETVAIEALNRLGVKWKFGQAIEDYNAGETTQVPAVFSVRLSSRFRGVISAEGRTVIFEDNINAR